MAEKCSTKKENTIGHLQDLKQDTSDMRKEIRTGLTAYKRRNSHAA